MKGSSRWFFFFCSGALMFAQPVLRFKVPPAAHAEASTDSRDAIGREDPINRLPRLPLALRTHVIVQFGQPPSAQTLAALTARGALVLQYLPDNGVLVSINARVRLNNLGILSAALLDPLAKISPLIMAGNALTASGYYLVELHPDADPNAARRLILNLGLELRDNPDLLRQHLMVHTANASTARATLQFLATQDPIAYIFPASASLIAGSPINVCGGALTVLGPIGQIIATNGDGWDGPGLNATTLSYFFQYVTAQLPIAVSEGEILRAMAEWAKVIQLTWQPGASSVGNRTVNVLFATGAHGDDFPFDGPGGVIAHTFYPFPPNPEPLAGDVHFDDSESWHVGANVDLFSVALHELGHALGLGHSDNPNDVMYPYLKIVSGLADGDKAAILTLYAARTGTIPPGPLVLTVNVPPAATTSAAITLSGTVTGGSGAPAVTWVTSTGASDGASISGVNWTILSVPLAIGLNSITVTATDATGSVSQTVSVSRLIIPPNPSPLVLTVNLPPAATTSAAITLSGTVTGGSSAPAVTWVTSTGASDGASISGVNWTILSVPLAIGLNSITVTATDATGSVSRTVSVTRQTVTPPVPGPLVLTVNVPPATTTSATISLSGTVSGGSGGIAVTWVTSTAASDGSTISGVNWNISDIPLAIGLNIITVTAADPTESVSRILNVTRLTVIVPPVGTDTTGPTLNITYPSSTSLATTLASLTFTGTASDPSGVASVTWSTDTGGAGTASGTAQWSAAIPLLVGFNQVIIRATDTVGNMSWRSVVVTRR
ncbi:MAG: peptidase and matrixin and adamalysin [Bryobacterales bacterium]|nr:peptidase and matrixin and adamalysin [Bryobacterales bacterium]